MITDHIAFLARIFVCFMLLLVMLLICLKIDVYFENKLTSRVQQIKKQKTTVYRNVTLHPTAFTVFHIDGEFRFPPSHRYSKLFKMDQTNSQKCTSLTAAHTNTKRSNGNTRTNTRKTK